MLRSSLLLLLLALPVSAAPAPFPTAAKSRAPARSTLVGTWEAKWGGVRCLITLAANGEYTCEWGGLRYVGSWSLDRDGRVLITESTRPDEARSWRFHTVRISRGSPGGPLEVGGNDLTIQLERPAQRPSSNFSTAMGRRYTAR